MLGFRRDIEGLRAIAVIAVVLAHAGVPFARGGYVGVDVFFVISGFLITSYLWREAATTGRIGIVAFYARRALRLLPAAVLVVGATLLAAWLWLPPLRLRSIAGDALAATVYGLNYRLAGQGTDYFAVDAAPSPLQHFWSLAVEEQFYLVWPLLLAAVAVWGATRPRRWAVPPRSSPPDAPATTRECNDCWAPVRARAWARCRTPGTCGTGRSWSSHRPRSGSSCGPVRAWCWRSGR
jgi:peptidoglycan/LPS O-acetylase OafA/YrhL